MQKLYDYRCKIAYRAICVVFGYLYNMREDQDDPEMDGSELAKLAKKLSANRDQFIFKGMENERRVS